MTQVSSLCEPSQCGTLAFQADSFGDERRPSATAERLCTAGNNASDAR